MAPIFVLELPYLSIGIAKVDIIFKSANFSAKIFQKSAVLLLS